VHNHNLLSGAVAIASSLVVAVVSFHDLPPFRLHSGRCKLGGDVVNGTAGILLHDNWDWLHHSTNYSFPGNNTNSPTNTTTNAPSHTTPPTSNSTSSHRGSIQLCHRLGGHVGRGQEEVVLRASSQGMPSNCATTSCDANSTCAPSRSLQLRRWLC